MGSDSYPHYVKIGKISVIYDYTDNLEEDLSDIITNLTLKDMIIVFIYATNKIKGLGDKGPKYIKDENESLKLKFYTKTKMEIQNIKITISQLMRLGLH